jgi:GxxExxY protein
VRINDITKEVIGAAIEVHRTLGPGLLESTYKQCLCRELQLRQLPFAWEQPLPLVYKGLKLECGYRVDLVVAGTVVVEVKAIDRLAPVHEAQLLTYLRLGGWKVGLLINFHVALLRDGIVRRVLGLEEVAAVLEPRRRRDTEF